MLDCILSRCFGTWAATSRGLDRCGGFSHCRRSPRDRRSYATPFEVLSNASAAPEPTRHVAYPVEVVSRTLREAVKLRSESDSGTVTGTVEMQVVEGQYLRR